MFELVSSRLSPAVSQFDPACPGVCVCSVKDEAGRESPALHGERECENGTLEGRRSSRLLTDVWVSV